ncbi:MULTISPECIES: ferritin-like fold-containing protein [Gordonia]|uniref:ferritin-like fold-containing protein n=1 Tax=Gordonia TaxID=2053 RepID=UPI0007E49780|nr:MULTISPECIES: ferritin-like fold-containing protein [Gordonia]MCG7635504.1 ferritin-like domain-containing protein [Gordonia sp. McavH-238-E]UPW07888.1 ferritin-like domain-containing protein [Gordonia terrae]
MAPAPDPSESIPSAATSTTVVSAEMQDSAIGKLFAVLLAGEFAAFHRLIEESAMAPDVPSRIAIARMAASEVGHFDRLAERVEAMTGLGAAEAVERYRSVFDQYHRATTPKTWYEALVKAYVGDGLAADFYAELSDMLPPDSQAVMAEVMSETANSEFARDQVRAAVEADPSIKSALVLWGRRLLGEAITHAQWVLAAEEEVTDLLFAGASSLTGVAGFFDVVAGKHADRMADLGLA